MNQLKNTYQQLEGVAEKLSVESKQAPVEQMGNLAVVQRKTTRKNWIGMRQGKIQIIALQKSGTHRQSAKWLCQCDCGNSKIISSQSLRRGTKSCGCLIVDAAKRRFIHKKTNTKTYKSWSSMIQRCNNPNNPKYYRYGGRGIKVCDDWRIFKNFLNDMGECPKNHTIDRINNNGNYCIENCRWANIKTQARNRSNNRMIEINGQTKTMVEWCDIKNVSHVMVRMRIHRGMNPIDAILKEPRKWQ
jgi:hypothetical protein